jgi:hypothetical protein
MSAAAVAMSPYDGTYLLIAGWTPTAVTNSDRRTVGLLWSPPEAPNVMWRQREAIAIQVVRDRRGE